MKVSDTVLPKVNHERRLMKKSTGNGSSNSQTPSSRAVKVERTLKTKNSVQSDASSDRKTRDSARKKQRSEKLAEDDKTTTTSSSIITNKKPWIPCTRRPSKPKPPPAIIEMELSLIDSNKVCKKFPHSPTPDSSDNEKCKTKPSSATIPKANNKNGHCHQITATCASDVASKTKTTSTKRTNVLTRQLALDNPPSNLKESFSVSEESLNSITSVTQLLKIERSSYAYGSSKSSNSAYEDDDEDEEVATGGVKLLAARWQARNDNKDTINTHQNGILKKNKSNESVRSNKSNDGDCLYSNTKLSQAIKENGLKKDIMATNQENKKEKIKTTNTKESKSMSSIGHTLASLSKSKQQERRKNGASKSPATTTTSDASSSVLLNAATAITTSPIDRKMKRTTASLNSTSSPLSSPSPSSNRRATSVGLGTAKKLEEFSSATKNVTSTLNQSKPRSRSTSPIKSSSVTSSPNKSSTAAATTPLLSRERSTRRSTEVDTTFHSKSSTNPNRFNNQDQQRRRSRSVSSTPGLPSYAAATTTSLAKQTNQIRDHKEESTRTNNKNLSYHKSHLINANTSSLNPTAATLHGTSSDTRGGQGQQKNVVLLKKNRIKDSHSARKTYPQQIASQLKNTNTSITATTSSVRSTSPTLSSSASSVKNNKKTDTKRGSSKKKDTVTKFGSGSTAKLDVCNNKSDWQVSTFAGKRKLEEANYPASSNYSISSSSSSPAKPTFAPCKPKAKQPQRIIPSIIMSEYVDEDNKDGKKTKLAHTKSLFTPLQFNEPLEAACDIREGSSLELRVRVKGAEAVIWVKESTILPNLPPYFEYFQDKLCDIYGLRIADVFLEDSGLYICEAYSAGGSEIACWCEVKVLESRPTKEEDYDVDISWEDLNMSEEVQNPQPLVVPVVVTSQAELESEPSPPFETAMTKEPSPIRTVTVKQVDRKVDGHSSTKAVQNKNRNQTNGSSSHVYENDHEHTTDYNQRMSSRQCSGSQQQQHPKKSSLRESAFPNSFAVAEQIKGGDYAKVQGARIVSSNRVKSLTSLFSAKQETNVNYKRGGNESMTAAGQARKTVTKFVAASITKETRFKQPEEIIKRYPITDATTVSVILPPHADHLAMQSDTNHPRHQEDDESSSKRKLTSELSSASDESIYLKEARSCDEDAVSSEENSASASLETKSNVTNDEVEDTTITSVDSPLPVVSSPCSEQNGRSSSVDSAIGFLSRPLFSDGKFPPRILVGPNNIIALYDEVVHLRVKIQNYGIPKTAVNWFKFVNGTYKKIELNSGDQSSSQGEAHISITKCGTSLNTLTINHINYDDCGRYRVKVQNVLGMDSHDCLLTVEGPPEAPGTPPKVKYDDKSKTILIQWSSCPYDGGSKITGYYVETSIVQGSKTAINRDDLDNWQLLTPQSYSWLCYTLTNPKRGSVYRFRVFGENSYGKGKPTEPSLPLLVPVLMEGRRAGSSDALLWSLKSLSPEESSLRNDSNRKLVQESQAATAVQEEEEPLEYKNVTVKRDSFYDIYEKLDELGKGRYGIVFKVQLKETKKSFAGKFVKCIKAKDKDRVLLEVKIMNDLGYHPKLICLIDAFEMPREIIIVTQIINGGELFERVVADDFTLTEGDCITFLRQICDAVRFIHAKNIMHLDLKPENILCTSKDTNFIKIIDFGLAQYYDPKEAIRVMFGTAEFVSPEIINYEPIAPSTDNWSIGVITYILLSGLSPFMGDNDNETFSNITRAEFDFEDEAFEKISDDAKDFISSLIVKRPEKRLTAEQCLTHRWLKQESVDLKKGIILPTDKLKSFLVRRKWQKTGNALRALSRIMNSRRSSSASSTTTPTGSPSVSMSISSPPPPSSFRSGSLVLQESVEDNVFFPHSAATSPDHNLQLNNTINSQVINHVQVSDTITQSSVDNSKTITRRLQFAEPSRTDSGVSDIDDSVSSSLNYD